MAGVMDTLISGIVKSAMSEILKKTIGRSSATKRTKRKTRTTAAPSTTTSSRSRSKKAGPTSGSSGRGAKATGVAKKQVSKRRTVAARAKARRR
ncbi:MAG: hypothetical protein JWL86_2055 [Rhizobium sp.]|nr:hypothetical protein [Rhizobium sp.]